MRCWLNLNLCDILKMRTWIKNMFQTVQFPLGIASLQAKKKHAQGIDEWKKNGSPSPPPHIIKQKIIQQYQKQYGCEVFVETGTFLGDMVEAQRRYFKMIYSIELGVRLYENAKNRFVKNKNVVIALGDSSNVLPKILTKIHQPAIFWLDGHYSEGITAKGEKECPIIEELNAIFNAPRYNHILLIDDARCFTGEGDYPSIEALTEYIHKKEKRYKVEIQNDVIRCTIRSEVQSIF